LLHARKEAYESCADLIIDVDDKNIAQVMDIIESHLQGVSEK
jgi:shikimate kinase